MEANKQNQDTFRRLHERFIPRLYRTALCILGDGSAAEQAAAEAFLEAVSDKSLCLDERAFGLRADSVLVCRCGLLQPRNGGYTPPTELPQALVGMLSGMDFSGRCMAVLAAEGRSVHEIAQILRRPEWTTARRLRRITETLCSYRVGLCC